MSKAERNVDPDMLQTEGKQPARAPSQGAPNLGPARMRRRGLGVQGRQIPGMSGCLGGRPELTVAAGGPARRPRRALQSSWQELCWRGILVLRRAQLPALVEPSHVS